MAQTSEAPRGRERGGVLACVLAAGDASRMGASKLTLPLHDAEGRETCLLEHACQAALASAADGVCVVTGGHAPEVRGALARLRAEGAGLREVENPDWAAGQASSVRAAARAAEEAGCAALIIMTADEPFVEARHIDALVRAWRVGKDTPGQTGRPRAYQTACDGRRGTPCLFPRAAFRLLAGLVGDEGARSLFRSGALEGIPVPTDDARVFTDVDTPEELARLRRYLAGGSFTGSPSGPSKRRPTPVSTLASSTQNRSML